jgi:hypothetical protein
MLGRETEGVRWLEMSCRGLPKRADCAIALGEHYAAKGDRARALASARDAVQRDPRSARARKLLEALEQGKGDEPQ